MANRLLIIMVNADPHNPTALSPLFAQATCAATMEYDVEIVITGRAGELALKNVAAGTPDARDKNKTIYHLIKEAYDAGVRFKVCAPALEQWTDEELIPEIEETVGGAYIISEAMDDDTVTLTY